MLLVYLDLLLPRDQQRIKDLDHRAKYWPRSWASSYDYNHAVPCEWYISFSHRRCGLLWLIEYSHKEHVIVYEN